MNAEEIAKKISTAKSIQEAEPLLQEAYNKNYIGPFFSAINNKAILSQPPLVNIIVNFTEKLSKDQKSIYSVSDILAAILQDGKFSVDTKKKIIAILLGNKTLLARAILLDETPPDITDTLISFGKLNLIRTTTNDTYLNEILKELREGIIWSNERSAIILLSRLIQNNQDDFISESAKYNLGVPVSLLFIEAWNSHARTNPVLTRSLAENKSPGYSIAVNIRENKDPQSITTIILRYALELIEDPIINTKEQLKWIRSFVLDKINTSTNYIRNFFLINIGGKNIIDIILQYYPDDISIVLDTLFYNPNILMSIENTSTFEDIINYGMTLSKSNKGIEEKIFSIPENILRSIRLTPENKNTLYNHYNADEQTQTKEKPSITLKELENLIGKNNWYLKYSQIKDILIKEAGWKENIITSLLALMLMGFGISTIVNIAQKHNISEEEILKAKQNKEMMEKATKIYNDRQNQNNKIIIENKQPIQEESKKDLPNKNIKMQENIIARTLYAEGRSEGKSGVIAIASVIHNRGRGNVDKMIFEIKRPYQFSCWNNATEKDWNTIKEFSGPAWNMCKQVANDMINGKFTPISNYNHYYNPQIANPKWAYLDEKKQNHRPYTTIGKHRFLKI